MLKNNISVQITGQIYDIEGIPVMFPKVPYPCQVEYMSSTIRALNTGQNALLESPTGTGKTLSLLCSALAWQQKKSNEIKAMKAEIQARQVPNVFSHNASHLPAAPTTPAVIIYASRTHTQIAQVVKELKATAYRPKMIVLGSRDQLCIHEKLSKMKGNALNLACNNLVKQHSCMYRNNLDTRISTNDNGNLPLSTNVMDIEDIVKVGKESRFCPYFYSRQLATDAELVLLPYNYLLDATMRSRITLNWNNAIVIFDEAHNVERVASDAASVSITSTDIASSIEEMQSVLRILREQGPDTNQKETSSSSSSSAAVAALDKVGEGFDSSLKLPTLDTSLQILKALFALEQHLDAVPLSMCGVGNTPACIMPGNWMKAMLEASGFQEKMVGTYMIECKNCIGLLEQEAQSATIFGSESGVTLSSTGSKLDMVVRCLDRVFKYDPWSMSNNSFHPSPSRLSDGSDYKVYICEKDREVSAGVSKQYVKTRVINYWAFSPGIALEDLKRLGVRSIIMTSGTLSPMDSFTDDMKLPFPIQLQNDHVITEKQIWVGAMTTGATGKQLNSSYNNRETREYKDELGLSILMILQTMIGNNCIGGLPQAAELTGGVLVFFPSYGVMDSAVSRWKETGLYNRLVVAGGGVVVEPKTSSAPTARTQSSTSSYNSSNNNHHSDVKKISFVEPTSRAQAVVDTNDPEEADVLRGIVGEFEAVLKRSRRCVLLAVCRGKVSEGIDFSDDRGRVVIITGLPYSPYMDPWVVLKKQYLDEKSKATRSVLAPRLSTSSSSHKLTLINGQEWYQQSATRAVNQAIGRVIRHKNDWGAIVLLDDRFLAHRQTSQLSKWVRPRHKGYQSFIESMVDFRKFISIALNDPNLAISSTSVTAHHISQPKAYSRPMMKKMDNNAVDDVFTNEMVLMDSDIPTQPDGTTFIHPNLILSRQTSTSLSILSSSISSLPGMKYSNPLDEEDGLDIGKHFQRVSSSQSQSLSQPRLSQSNHDHHVKKQSIHDKPAIAPVNIFDRKSRPISSSSSSSSSLSRRIMISYDNTSSNTQPSHQISSPNKFSLNSLDWMQSSIASSLITATANTAAMKPSLPIAALSQSQATPTSIISLAEQDAARYFQSIVGDENYSVIDKMKEVIMQKPWKSSKEVNDFAGTIIALIPEEFTVDIRKIISSFRSIIASKWVDIFRHEMTSLWTVKHAPYVDSQLSVTSKAKPSSIKTERTINSGTPDKMKNEDNGDNTKTVIVEGSDTFDMSPQMVIKTLSSASATIPPSSSYASQSNQYPSQSQAGSKQSAYLPSKRANAMLDAMKENKSSSSIHNTSLAKKSRIDDIFSRVKPKPVSTSAPHAANFFDSLDSSQLNLPDNTVRRDVVSSKLDCLICKEKATNPCAGKCGHVCCAECWKIWLATKASCPLCRVTMTRDSVAKIILR